MIFLDFFLSVTFLTKNNDFLTRLEDKRPIGRFLLALRALGEKWPKIVCYGVPTKL